METTSIPKIVFEKVPAAADAGADVQRVIADKHLLDGNGSAGRGSGKINAQQD